MGPKIKISVVIPVYNGAKWISQCLEGVLCQSYKNLEIIVIDDGSTDDTATIVARRPEVKLVSQENQGLSVSRNRGVEAATGDYIHFLDVDDLICLDYYASMAEAIALTDADMAFGGYINGIQPTMSLLYSDRFLAVSLPDRISLSGVGVLGYAWRYLVRRSLLTGNDLRFEPGRFMEDVAFSLEAVRLAEKIVTVPGAVYDYKKREGSLINTRDRESALRRRNDVRLAVEFRAEFFRKHGLGEPVTVAQWFKYKFLGVTAVKKFVYNNGRTKWYLFGARVQEKK